MKEKAITSKYKGKYHYGYSGLYIFAAVLVLALFVFRGVPINDVYVSRTEQSRHELNIERSRIIQNSDAPAGIEKEYILIPELTDGSENSLVFYQVHHSIEIFADGELAYSLKPGDNGGVPRVGSSWVVFPLHEKDEGKELRVVMTPLYSEVKGKVPAFYVGSSYEILHRQIIRDIPDIAASFLVLVAGIAFAGISIITLIAYKQTNSLIYLACFSMAIGLWKLMDMRSATLLMEFSPPLLSSVSLIMLPLAVASVLLFVQKEFRIKKYRLLDFACVCAPVVVALEMLMHVFGVMALRESLVLTHALVGLAVVAGGSAVLMEWSENRNNFKMLVTSVCFMLCIAASLADIAGYYISGSSNNASSILIVFFVYIIVLGTTTLMELRQEASVDFITGMYNRNRCNTLIQDETELPQKTCFVMFDINGLKNVNDTLGHEAGNELIRNFSKLLRRCMPARTFLGRYGGDEFIAVLHDCGEETTEKLIAEFEEAVTVHNGENPELPISYSAGYAISAGEPGCTMQTLLTEADRKMYLNKKAYYEKHDRRGR